LRTEAQEKTSSGFRGEAIREVKKTGYGGQGRPKIGEKGVSRRTQSLSKRQEKVAFNRGVEEHEKESRAPEKRKTKGGVAGASYGGSKTREKDNKALGDD